MQSLACEKHDVRVQKGNRKTKETDLNFENQNAKHHVQRPTGDCSVRQTKQYVSLSVGAFFCSFVCFSSGESCIWFSACNAGKLEKPPFFGVTQKSPVPLAVT